ncbi:MAG: hypothetical protein IPK26_05865 [Planctomycetes bacterium]|nr:hypothetical protein [Planctomycetota bacterium]
MKPSSRRPPCAPIRLHIEELGLAGFAASERDRIASSFATALERLLLEQGLPPRTAAGSARPPLRLTLRAREGPESIGARLAQLVHRRLVP